MTYTVDSVSTAIELLFLISECGGNGVTELAKRLGITKARAFRLLATLEECGLVCRQMPMATYILGYRALIIGVAAQVQLNLIRIAKDLLEPIGRECNESVLVRVRDGLETVCAASWDAPHTVRVHNQLGDRRPLFVGASGKLLLAHAPEDIQRTVLRSKLERFTPNTIVNRTELKQELERVRTEGYSVSFAEKAADTVAVAAPIRDASGVVVASLSITMPSSRASKEKVDKYIIFIKHAAVRFSAALGHMEE